MAKSKHQKLADLMQQMLDVIEGHFLKVAQELNKVQLHFYEKQVVVGRPLMPQKVLKKMMRGHYIGLQYLSPKDDLRDIAKSVPMIGVVLSPPAKIVPRQTNGYFIPWGVQIVVPEDNREKLDQGRLRALLYCPGPGEISNELDWFEEEDASDSLTHQFMSIFEYERRQYIVRKNLLKDPIPLWNKAKEEWMSDPSEDSDEDISHEAVKNPRDLDAVDFAPSKGQSLALAYEEVMMSIRRRERRHRDSLRNIYKSRLIETMFDGVPWSEEQREAFLKQWQNNFFKGHSNKKNVKPGRWEQCRVIDRYTAAKFIRHFLERFINNPKNKKDGEVACILWVLIWVAQEEKSDHITLQKVLKLSTQDIDLEDAKITVGGVELGISWGLHQLLCCLCGKGEGRRPRRIFANIDTTGKFLERALHSASNELLPEDATPVQPSAFLTSPHLYPGVRMTVAQRKAMKKAHPIVKPLYTHRDVKKMLREAQNRS